MMNIQELTDKSQEAAELLSLLANPQRLKILCALLAGERYVGELVRDIGLSQSALSQHLARLREGGVVTVRREAQTIYYSIADERAARILAVLEDLFCKPETDEDGGRT